MVWWVSLLMVRILTSETAAISKFEEEYEPLLQQQETQVLRERVVQNPMYLRQHELFVATTLLPTNPYYNVFAFGVGYALRLNQTFGLDLFGVALSLKQTKALERELTDKVTKLTGNPPKLNFVQYYGTLRANIAFLYGKLVFSDEQVLHFETTASVGPAFVYNLRSIGFGANVALGVRTFLSEQSSLRFEIGDLIYSTTKLHQKSDLYLQLAIAYAFGVM